MTAQIIDGKAIAKDLRAAVEAEAARLASDHGITPGLAVVLVGDDPASAIYVASKEKMTVKLGMNSFAHRLPGDTKQEDLLALIRALNADKAVHGILVQMPLPGHLDPDAVLRTLDAAKDVDGLHVESIGRLVTGQPGFAPCTPQGCIRLIKSTGRKMAGLHAVVLGRSNLVGKPVSQLLLRENCTVTMCHSRTQNLEDIVRQADILVAATGRPEMVKGDWVKKGAIVIDVGINRMEDGSIVGDVDYDAASQVADFITPVPGGVGPMTIACLLSNTIKAACLQNGLPVPKAMA